MERDESRKRNGTRETGWTWEAIRALCPGRFRVEEENFPRTNSGVDLGGRRIPCTDGETLFIPAGTLEERASFFFHELGHALMHYLGGPDPDLEDPLPRRESLLEAEACLFAVGCLQDLGIRDLYNGWYLAGWRGDPSGLDRAKVERWRAEIVRAYRSGRAAA